MKNNWHFLKSDLSLLQLLWKIQWCLFCVFQQAVWRFTMSQNRELLENNYFPLYLQPNQVHRISLIRGWQNGTFQCNRWSNEERAIMGKMNRKRHELPFFRWQKKKTIKRISTCQWWVLQVMSLCPAVSEAVSWPFPLNSLVLIDLNGTVSNIGTEYILVPKPQYSFIPSSNVMLRDIIAAGLTWHNTYVWKMIWWTNRSWVCLTVPMCS